MAKKPLKVDQVQVVVHEGPLMIPDGLTDERAIEVLQRRIAYNNQRFIPKADFTDVFIWEAAYAFNEVLKAQFGWAGARSVKTWFGDIHPEMIGVQIGPHEHVQIPWGQFVVPGIDGYLEATSFQRVRGGPHFFRITGEVRRRNEKKVNDLIEGVREYIRTHSIYRNKAFRLVLTDVSGNYLPFPELTFEPLPPADEAELVLSEATDRMVRVNLFTPIERTDEVRKIEVPLKRGTLLAGEYGTGKSMIMKVAGIKALRNGWTYIICEKPHELAAIIRIARRYQPCVVAMEDLDRIASGDRNEEIDMILNVIDGVEAKGTEIMVVLTTNELDRIHPSILRAGRMDAIVIVEPPDGPAAERLARQYARGLIHEDEPLLASRHMMAGKIPSTIREIVERSKLAALDSTPPGEPFQIRDEDLVTSTLQMEEHIKRATPKPSDDRSDREKAADRLGDKLVEAAGARYAVADSQRSWFDDGELVAAGHSLLDEEDGIPR